MKKFALSLLLVSSVVVASDAVNSEETTARVVIGASWSAEDEATLASLSSEDRAAFDALSDEAKMLFLAAKRSLVAAPAVEAPVAEEASN